jgi:hypothetical protein
VSALANHKLVCVVWDDAHSPSGAFTADEIRRDQHKPVRYNSFGLLIADDERGISIAQEQDNDGGLRGVTFVPRGMVVDVIDFGIPKRRTPRKAKAAPTQEGQ